MGAVVYRGPRGISVEGIEDPAVGERASPPNPKLRRQAFPRWPGAARAGDRSGPNLGDEQ